MEITVDQMYQIENKGHDMGFFKKIYDGKCWCCGCKKIN